MNVKVDTCIPYVMIFCLSISCVTIYELIEQNQKCNQCIFLSCIKIDIAKSVQVYKHTIKFGQASGTGTAMPVLMKQIAIY